MLVIANNEFLTAKHDRVCHDHTDEDKRLFRIFELRQQYFVVQNDRRILIAWQDREERHIQGWGERGLFFKDQWSQSGFFFEDPHPRTWLMRIWLVFRHSVFALTFRRVSGSSHVKFFQFLLPHLVSHFISSFYSSLLSHSVKAWHDWSDITWREKRLVYVDSCLPSLPS